MKGYWDTVTCGVRWGGGEDTLYLPARGQSLYYILNLEQRQSWGWGAASIILYHILQALLAGWQEEEEEMSGSLYKQHPLCFWAEDQEISETSGRASY